MLRTARLTPCLEELSFRELVVRIRWERAKRAALEPGSAAYLRVGLAEAHLTRELHRRFGVEDITASDLEWDVGADRDGRGQREPVEPA